MAKWTQVTTEQQLTENSTQSVIAKGQPLVLCKSGDQIYAFDNACPHAGLPLGDGAFCGETIICPFHGYTYDVKTGKNTDFPDDAAVQTYPTRCVDGQVQVDMQAPIALPDSQNS